MATDLLDFVEMASVECLNQKPEHSVSNALQQGPREDDGLHLESDTDEQLLIHIPFNQGVKIHSVTIMGPDDGCGPMRVKLFTNQPTIGFSEAADSPAVQGFSLSDQNLKGTPVQLRFVKFQNVNCLSIFVESNHGNKETTKITKIAIGGYSGEVMNVAAIKDQPKQG